MKKKGFTLVELLAVIAILAILVIIALPNVLNMFRNAKQNTFATEVQNLVRSAEDKYLTTSLSNGNNTCFDSKTNKLDMGGRDDIVYVIKLTNKGKVIEVKVVDKSYQLIANEENGINRADIGNKYKVETRNKTTEILDCNNNVLIEGEETGEDTTYKIQFIEDLVELSKKVNNGETYEGKTFILTNNLNFQNKESYKDSETTKYKDINGNGEDETLIIELTTGSGFEPIGVGDNHFKGNFDGQNHRIDNLYIKNTDTESLSLGLFGKIENSTISNLTISGNIENGTKPSNVGMISDVYGTSKIVNCTNEINISSKISDSSIAGLVSTVISNGSLTIENSINKGQISGGSYIGGLIGEVAPNANLIIKNSENQGVISTNSTNIGGLIGYLNTNTNTIVENSYNNAEINFNSNEDKDANIGGLIGYVIDGSTLKITNSGNNKNISNLHTEFETLKHIRLSGLIGYAVKNNNLIIENSFNNGELNNGTKMGGLIGLVQECEKVIIDKSKNTKKISQTALISDTVTLDKTIGGLVSYTNYDTKLYILNSYNSGVIDGNMTTRPAGLVGYNYGNANTQIYNSYNIGNVNNTNGESNGIATVSGTNVSSLTLNNVYNLGNVNNNGIGFVAVNTVLNIKNVYYKNDTIKKGMNLSNDNELTVGKSENEMKVQTFVDTLNTNKGLINLSEIDSELSGYTLCDWKLGDSGYPELDCK